MSESREIIAFACYSNDMHVHNDPPLWEGPPDITVSDADRKRYFEDADYIIAELAKAGFEISRRS